MDSSKSEKNSSISSSMITINETTRRSVVAAMENGANIAPQDARSLSQAFQGAALAWASGKYVLVHDNVNNVFKPLTAQLQIWLLYQFLKALCALIPKAVTMADSISTDIGNDCGPGGVLDLDVEQPDEPPVGDAKRVKLEFCIYRAKYALTEILRSYTMQNNETLIFTKARLDSLLGGNGIFGPDIKPLAIRQAFLHVLIDLVLSAVRNGATVQVNGVDRDVNDLITAPDIDTSDGSAWKLAVAKVKREGYRSIQENEETLITRFIRRLCPQEKDFRDIMQQVNNLNLVNVALVQNSLYGVDIGDETGFFKTEVINLQYHDSAMLRWNCDNSSEWIYLHLIELTLLIKLYVIIIAVLVKATAFTLND